MSENNIQDDYIDLMLHLAFHMEAEDEAQFLLKQDGQEWTDAAAHSADNAYFSAWATAEEHRRTQAASDRKQRIRKTLLQGGKTIACIVIVLALAFPVALATSAEFRSYVMTLMMVWDQTKGEAHFSFTKQTENSFSVPDDWEGEWYPSYIPSDMTLYGIEKRILRAEYRDAFGAVLWFYELDEHANSMMGTDGGTISEVEINGRIGWLLVEDSPEENPERASVVWAEDDKWFKLDTYRIGTTEVLRIATSVRKIVR